MQYIIRHCFFVLTKSCIHTIILYFSLNEFDMAGNHIKQWNQLLIHLNILISNIFYSSDDEDTIFDHFDKKFGDNAIDYYGDNIALKGLRNITMMATPIIHMLLQDKQSYKVKYMQ